MALRAKKWGFGLIRKALDFPEVVTMELRSELTGGGMERVFGGVGTAGLKTVLRGNIVYKKEGPSTEGQGEKGTSQAEGTDCQSS